MSSRFKWFALVTLSFLAGCDRPAGQMALEVNGGTDSTDNSVMMIYDSMPDTANACRNITNTACSATVLCSKVLLTVGHCGSSAKKVSVSQHGLTFLLGPPNIYTAPVPDAEVLETSSLSLLSNPDGTTDGLLALHLATPLPAYSYSAPTLDAYHVWAHGETGKLVGYGTSQVGGTDLGNRRQGTILFDQYSTTNVVPGTPHYMLFNEGTTHNHGLPGDSGGAVFNPTGLLSGIEQGAPFGQDPATSTNDLVIPIAENYDWIKGITDQWCPPAACPSGQAWRSVYAKPDSCGINYYCDQPCDNANARKFRKVEAVCAALGVYGRSIYYQRWNGQSYIPAPYTCPCQ